MVRVPRVRVAATELTGSTEVIRTLVGSGMSATEAVATLTRSSARLRRSLRLPEGGGPIVIDGDTVTVEGVAGVIRLAPSVELDVAPKFLGFEHPGWREDLLAIANYTSRGSFLPRQVRAGIGEVGDLASVIGRAFVAEFWQHYRKPLRLYRHQRWRDFELVGELDPDLAHDQSVDGLPQRAMVLDRRNSYNAVIAAAADALVGDVRDPSVRSQLLRVRSFLGAQPPARPERMRPVPSRHRSWADLVELSKAIALGVDLTLHAGSFESPGYVVRTWEAWEQLVYRALRSRFGFGRVTHNEFHIWGEREGRHLFVRPDVTIRGTVSPLLVDAKYKSRLRGERRRISQSDLMEAAAFMSACEAERILLVYPRSGAARRMACGGTEVFDSATIVPGRRIIGIEAEVRGFSARDAHRGFAERLSVAVEEGFGRDDPHPGNVLA